MNSNGVVPLVVACGLAVAAGMFAPQMWESFSGDTAKKSSAKSSSNPDAKDDKVIGPYIQFDRVTVNLNEDELNRSFLLALTLECEENGNDKDPAVESRLVKEKMLDTLVRRRRPLLKSWLTTHLAEKTLESLRGKNGVERLRREIKANFNRILFPSGKYELKDVHFDEYFVEPAK